ncbi:MAG: hydroxysqualene dehydroxylase HpnE [Rhodoferax sp.]
MSTSAGPRVAVVGAGWAGLAAAVALVRAGCAVQVFEAAAQAGGRARSLPVTLPNGEPAVLDNGQHILIGAYTQTLALMRSLGLDPDALLMRTPLRLRFPDESGLSLPHWPAPLDVLAGIAGVRSWPLRQRLGLLATALRWRMQGFACDAKLSVAQLCHALGSAVQRDLIEPLCVSALNTAPEAASAQVFLRVLRDALLGPAGSSHLLLPRRPLGALGPDAAVVWLRARGATLVLGQRVAAMQTLPGGGWQLNGQRVDHVVWATSWHHAALAHMQTALAASDSIAKSIRLWVDTARALQPAAIATVYAWAPGARLPEPLLALRSDAHAPAQFVADRGQLGGPAGLMALVVSAACGSRQSLTDAALAQAQAQLGLDLTPVKTVVEKQATFACTPALQRPSARIAPGLWACGDYVAGPYPATIEGAVRSGQDVARLIINS